MLKKKINLCFVYPETDSWTGEVNYIKSLLSSLLLLKSKRLKLFIFCSNKQKKNLSKFIYKTRIISSVYFEKNSIFLILRKIIKLIFKKDLILQYFLKKNKINVISHYLPVNGIKSVCWIPDLQHLYLNFFFSKRELIRRDLLFNNYIENADKVIVSSKDTCSSLKKYYKIDKSKACILNFVPKVDFKEIKSFDYLKNKFNLKPNYIYIPNQFWKHKNHNILVKSAILLKKRNYKVKFVITGNVSSGEDQNIYLDFVKNINVNKVSDYFDLLGFVSYEDVINLIFYSQLLINPSLFEGWSTTVEEGKIFNKKMLLSDLSVHKEQCSDKAFYFKRNDPKELVKKIIKLSKVNSSYPKKSIVKKNYIKSRIIFAKNYLKIIASLV